MGALPRFFWAQPTLFSLGGVRCLQSSLADKAPLSLNSSGNSRTGLAWQLHGVLSYWGLSVVVLSLKWVSAWAPRVSEAFFEIRWNKPGLAAACSACLWVSTMGTSPSFTACALQSGAWNTTEPQKWVLRCTAMQGVPVWPWAASLQGSLACPWIPFCPKAWALQPVMVRQISQCLDEQHLLSSLHTNPFSKG